MQDKRQFLALIPTLALAAVLPPAHAQSPYPAKPIHIIVAFSAGSATDLITRAIGVQLQAALGQSVVIENKPGAAGNIAAQAVVRAAPDGYTLLATPSQIAINPWMQKLSFDTARDLTPVSQTVAGGYVLIATNSFPADDLDGMIEQARRAPGVLNYASVGSGSGPHLSMALLEQAAGIRLQHIQYKNSPQQLAAVIGGEVQLAFDTVASVLPLAKTGRIKVLAIAGPHPLDAFPGVSPISRRFPGFDTDGWQGIFAPAGTPRDIVVRLATEIHAAVQSPEVSSLVESRGFRTVGSDTDQFSAYFASELKKYERVVKDNNIKAE